MYEAQLKAAIQAGLAAKDVIMEIYNKGFEVEIKSDNSPVTEADKKADELIRKMLHEAFPAYAFLTEESDDNLERLDNEYVWIIDPVDGTKDFVAKDGGFTTNIALCRNHEIVVGVIVAPALDEVYFATKGDGAFSYVNGRQTRLHVSDKLEDLICLKSVFHSNETEEALYKKHADKIKHVEKAGSSLKACYIAAGKADVSYRMSAGTKEWDTAAFDIIVTEAGGVVLKPDMTPITYNRVDVYNREGYVIANRKENILL